MAKTTPLGSTAAVNQAFRAAAGPGGFVAGITQASVANVQGAYAQDDATKYSYVQNDPNSFFGSPNFLSGLPSQGGTKANNAAFFDTTLISGTVELRPEDAERLGIGSFDIAQRWYDDVAQDSDVYTSRAARVDADYGGTSNFVTAPKVGSGLTDIPTSTTNYARPRTVAAGWAADKDENNQVINFEQGTLTVVFRDGTVYNYYDVSRSVWIKFHDSISKGKSFLNHANSVNPMEGTLLAYNHGPADVSTVDDSIRQAVYMAARTKQIYNRNPVGAAQHYTQLKNKTTAKPKKGAQIVNAAEVKLGATPIVRARTLTTGYRQPNQKPAASKPTPRNTSAQKKK